MQNLRSFTMAASSALLFACGDKGEEITIATVEEPVVLVLDGEKYAGNDLKPDEKQWKGEVFADEAGTVLRQLAGLLSSDSPISAASVAEIAREDVEGRINAGDTRIVFVDEAVTIRLLDTSEGDQVSPSWHGRESFAMELQRLKDAFRESVEIDVLLKIVNLEIDTSTGNWLSKVRFEARAQRKDSLLQQRADYLCEWDRNSATGSPQLHHITLERWEEAESPSAQPWFRDQTFAVLGSNKALRTQLSFGLDHWLRRIGRVHGMTYFKRHGITLGDANGDDLDDVYLCQAGGLPNKLFIQQPDGTAEDRSTDAGVDFLDHTASALFVDLDSDGDQDLALATFEGIVVLSNDGDTTFHQQAHLTFADMDLHSLSSVDFDNDGDLDLYVSVDYAASPSTSFLYHNANDGGRNRLYRNDGDWNFTDVTVESGLDVRNQRHSLATSWEDVDNDGDQDLYVANDYGQNCFYVNDGGSFSEVAVERGVVDYGSGMSVTWGDCDRDGDMDLYVGNMFSSAGSRIVSEPNFLPNAKSRGLYQRFVRGNSLYNNTGDASFTEVSNAGGASRGRWSWSSIFADLNNDGWEDLFAANGYITTEDPGDL